MTFEYEFINYLVLIILRNFSVFYAYVFLSFISVTIRTHVVTHQRSIAERGGCFQQRLFVSVYVCQHVNLRTMKRRMMTLGGYVQCTKISPEFACQDQRSKVKATGDKKRKSAALCSGVVFWGAVLMWHFFASGPRGRGSRGLACVPVLRRWENQRILSSLNQVNE